MTAIHVYVCGPLVFSSELLILCPEILPIEPAHNNGPYGHSRYEYARNWCSKYLVRVHKPEDASIFVFGQKYSPYSSCDYAHAALLSNTYNKPLLCFMNDDYEESLSHQLTKLTFLFRTSINKFHMGANEYPLAPTIPDCFEGHYLLESTPCRVSFCGQTSDGRKPWLEFLKNEPTIETAFVYRNGFWAPGISREQARREFLMNMQNSLFCFCMRGAGNFSYRFYECLMMARIPVLIDTDCALPHFDEIRRVCVVVREQDARLDLVKAIRQKYVDGSLYAAQRECRALWLRRFASDSIVTSCLSEVFKPR